MKNFSQIAAPLTKLTRGKKDVRNTRQRIEWNAEADRAFSELKQKLAENVLLTFPRFDRPFVLTTDASGTAIGGVLQRRDDHGFLRPLTFFSRALNKAELNYATIEQEALSIVYGLKVNRPLILGYEVLIQTDHRPLT